MQPNSTRTIKYTIVGAKGDLKVEVLSSGKIKAKIGDNTSAAGTLTVTTGSSIDEYDKVIMLATDGKTSAMSSIAFEEADCLKITNGTYYQLEANSSTIGINIETNTEYTLSIPEEAKSWISIVSSRAMRKETINLSIAPNEGTARTAVLGLIGKEGKSFGNIQINQNGKKTITIPDNMTQAFPDPWFQKYVIDNFDQDKDGIISQWEADDVHDINLSEYNYKTQIVSIDGIQYFQYLGYLYCNGLKLTNLDVSQNTALTTLDCDDNQLTSLDLTKNSALEFLNCNYNKLTSLKLPKSTVLANVGCNYNQLANLDVSGNIALTNLYCGANNLTKLDVSKNIALKMLGCSSNQLTSLDVSKNSAIIDLSCSDNKLTALDVSKNRALIDLSCGNNLLTSLDISKTNIGNSTRNIPLDCHNMPTLTTLYLKTGWSIKGITVNRDSKYIPDETQIIFVDVTE